MTLQLHETLRVYINPDNYIVEPSYLDASVLSENLVINRDTGVIRRNVPALPVYKQETVLTIYGLLGFLQLYSGDYMIVIKGRQKISTLLNYDIYKVSQVEILPVSRDLSQLSPEQKELELFYLKNVENLFASDDFYFSYGYDLSKSISSNISRLNSGVQSSLWRQFNEKYYFNRFLQKKMIDASSNFEESDLSAFILPVITGFVGIQQIQTNSKIPYYLALISRRNVKRLGTRYFSRGIDSSGNVSNNVETEQVVIINDGAEIYSYTQLRGSMPMFWRQIINTKYQPKLAVLNNSTNNENAFLKHVQDLRNSASRLVFINLVNSHGYESRPSSLFADICKKFSKQFNLTFIHFDFHLECAKMKWENISKLIQNLKQQGFLSDNSFTHISNGKILTMQDVLIRTNCMDCLDRTNVVQSEIAKYLLVMHLKQSKLLNFDDLDNDSVVHFKSIWADNADAISNQYSGTGALKTDFTRTGKRTFSGLIMDLLNSVIRYVKNNYQDGLKQDAYDLVSGNVQLSLLLNHSFIGSLLMRKNHYPLQFYLLPFLIILSVFMVIYSVLIADISLTTLLWLVPLIGSSYLVGYYNQDFVNMPTLVNPYFVNESDGQYLEYSSKTKDTELKTIISSKEA